ncbi:transglutaminase TgpA family protein [endosymbiont of Ridgeia piscesae]|jgi:transglutaminase-like putative cysteine protease|uniref:Putative cysteine protease n=1 Tax=endosymbiont of Ridgeia piscesae TaxID=54398 RepID=A0A0T5ZBT1_9GAMM|nr:DUF3488 and transglutaminase-like domain-containing protein [endosymbiont of Ridgeia piscesae]KRT54030.1 putative cysteine protease [endosymbiont of Ridgeia piscesae]KRT60259.1 protein of unknown function (DUF4129) [endosymbiont of Ridgeia piscesae]
MIRSQPLQRVIGSRSLLALLLLSTLSALPHARHMEVAVSLFFIVIVLWRFAAHSYARLQPGRSLLLIITIFGTWLVYSNYQTLLGREAGVALLCVMLGLKLMEMKQGRDIYVAVYISFFVIITQFIYDQSFLLAAYLFLLMLGLIAILNLSNRLQQGEDIWQIVRTTLRLALQALPLALFLFLLFPRVSTPLWQFFVDKSGGVTGLDEHVSPGSVSRLSQSQAIAFRAHFDGQLPAAESRYWRALVLWDSDGISWHNQQSKHRPLAKGVIQPLAPAIDYEVFVEPHYRKWLFALDLPALAPSGARLTETFQLVADKAVDREINYRLSSYLDYKTSPLKEHQLARALQQPDNITPRMSQLVADWRKLGGDDRQLIAAALEFFHSRPFVYTLNPPLYGQNPTDQFLFEGRQGFCEHYASSFALLMRIAGIPSRLVIGYLGGEYNPVGNYLILRQSDAHAWVEVWLADSGWVRIDPTTAVAPERLLSSISTARRGIGEPVLFRISEQSLLGQLGNRLVLALDAANMGWRRWVVGYSRARQFNLMRSLGFELRGMRQWMQLLLAVMAIVLVILALFIISRGRAGSDPVLKAYQRFCRKLQRVGIHRLRHEGPLDLAKRIAQQRPELATQTMEIIRLYIALRYQPHTRDTSNARFFQQVRRFHPGRER